MKLEYVDSLTLAHPFIKGFDQVSYCLSEEELRTVAQGEIPDAIAKRKKEDIEGKEGASSVHSTTFFIGLAIEPKQRESYPGITDFCFVMTDFILQSWCRWSSETRHLLSHDRVHKAGQSMGTLQ
jgi:poly(A) polymerase